MLDCLVTRGILYLFLDMIEVIILGSTGSIGTNTLKVIEHLKGMYRVFGIAGYGNVPALLGQARKYRPRFVTVLEPKAYTSVRRSLPKRDVLFGIEGMMQMVEHARADIVVMALRGVVGLAPMVAALQRGLRVCLATKEILVSYGELLKDFLGPNRLSILPVDSEHSAIHQCLFGRDYRTVKTLYLTSSGGPFFRRPGLARRAGIKDVLNHPTWKMGKKITVDSATLMNKGLEVIEAARLFGLDAARIKVLIHPQSIVHSLVEFVDHSILGQLSVPDMKLPIQYALTFPKRVEGLTRACDLTRIRRLDFCEPDLCRFPCLGLAYKALQAGGTMPAVLNSANEAVVDLFLARRLTFSAIPAVLSRVMARHRTVRNPKLEQIRSAEEWARVTAKGLVC